MKGARQRLGGAVLGCASELACWRAGGKSERMRNDVGGVTSEE